MRRLDLLHFGDYHALPVVKQSLHVETHTMSRRQIDSRSKTMKIRPLYDRIVVKRIEGQEATPRGIIIPDSAKEKSQEGEVVAVGHGKRLEDGKLIALDVKTGDRILFGKYSGSETTLNGAEYIIMREDDVLGVLDAAA
jgi:chaperonin GroES